MQSRLIIDLDLRFFYQNTQKQFNFLVLYITKFRQILSDDALEMIEWFVCMCNIYMNIRNKITFFNFELKILHFFF